jgi:hypothetical protein
VIGYVIWDIPALFYCIPASAQRFELIFYGIGVSGDDHFSFSLFCPFLRAGCLRGGRDRVPMNPYQ